MGRGDKDSWVTSYRIMYRTKLVSEFPGVTISWQWVKNSKGKTRTFKGNRDSFALVKHKFPPFKAQQLRIVPWTVEKAATLRFEFYKVLTEAQTNKEAKSVPCVCTVNRAVVFCPDCATPLCLGCDLHTHRSGGNGRHKRVHIDEYIKEMDPDHVGDLHGKGRCTGGRE